MEKTNLKKIIKKHKPNEILNMYRDNKIKLNKKEWDYIHKKIDKEQLVFRGIELTTILSFLLGLAIIIIIAFNFKSTNFETIKQCNKIKGHTCSRYEIEKMGD